MPERPPPDDPFADLFSKLPDPRSRDAMRSDAGAEPVARVSPRPAVDPPAPRPVRDQPTRRAPEPATPPESATPPLSRRAARAATTPPVPPAPAIPPRPASIPPEANAREPRARQARPARATATLDDLFTGEATTDALGAPPPRPDRRRRRIGGWIALGVVLLLIGGIAAGGAFVWTTYEDRIRAFMGWEEPRDYDAGIAEGDVTVTISSGDNGRAISTLLFDAGVTKTSSVFYDLLISTGDTSTFYPGAYGLQKQMTAAAALDALNDPASKLENTVQLREGLTVDQSASIISESLGIPVEDVQAAVADPNAYGVAADSLEGWLFPATYSFNPGVTAPEVVKTMVERAVSSLDAAGVPGDDRQRVLTVASIIQREARFEGDFYKVSRVIENRLDPGNQETFGLLQMDSTAQYGYGELHDGTVSSSQEALEDDNPWNTYVITGLPIGPIANPGDTAIDAAMHPADGPWLYFVTVNLDTGETLFTANYADHQQGVAQFQAWCGDHPDSGC